MADLSRQLFFYLACPTLTGYVGIIMFEARRFRAPALHIWMVAISYLIFLWGWGLEALSNVGDGPTWRAPLAWVAWWFGMYSMWIMFKHYRYANRERRHRNVSDTAVVKEANEIQRKESEGR
jgi:hypothetical protein